MPKTAVLVAYLLGLPLLSYGQAPAATPPDSATLPAPRVYVGLGLYISEYQPLSFDATRYAERLLPVQLTVGYQLRPRWAVQGSAAYSGYQSGYSQPASYPTPLPDVFTEFVLTSSRRNLSVAGLGRYTLTRKAARRLQADALGGATLVKQWFISGNYSDAPNGAGVYYLTGYTHRQVVGVLLTAGAALRYRLVPRLDATFEGTANVDLRGNFSGLSSSLALGLRYGFGKMQ
ncbi:hypothetical protein HHL22_01290 [Hymenobacter sp. RP-2-7]|uniref:Outer membrane protein beta-barrel domain-containing protein n=1 Tax=Hymenobacter polaris TaxID=2682546 RepID=A0A7Y0AAN7_9BACT|nr:hypothetical protein [Hymenobacter polaris]NML63828.1 hypothetical protein [Hymenobacter polaris]